MLGIGGKIMARKMATTASPINEVVIFGAGLMGSGIAQVRIIIISFPV